MYKNSKSERSSDDLNSRAVEILREYLRIPTIHPDIDYEDCVAFLRRQAASLQLPIHVHYVRPDKPVVIITWEGTDPAKSSILLNSHMDVVPVFEYEWTYPPFDAHMDEKGDIYARGIQDTKALGIQYLEAIRRLKLNGQRVSRTVHVSFVPDEEIGGIFGMKEYVRSEHFKSLNVSFMLDECCGDNNTPTFLFAYDEKTKLVLSIRCEGITGHGSLLYDNTAGEKFRVMIDRMMDFRASEKARMSQKHDFSDVTALNLTIVKGGLQNNVIPQEITAVIDVRLPPSRDPDEFEAIVKRWCEEAGPGVSYSFVEKNPQVKGTRIDDSNPFWMAFKNVFSEMGSELKPFVLPGTTDARFVRALGIPVLNFAPINNMTMLFHCSNECLNKDVFLKGIEIFTKIIPAIANV
ncbi:aminoacylase-1A [Harpegnathos saltator]|uniref:N-acyl-aliphatic-L-amino acid amidohydrolase n=1 Tax=Harpegnathos saltator TaxID=610380 RepID=E2C9E0_HARSA|nr:aminoacylase-1A [Harpegnathos saltator]XP_011153010.1 aminoacylase-1A [Harpegnathos saltator]XP_011153011.1 aminoacylase-1A [Harpegnathos saltator]XP_011153012.1 aminoacylase-1A [Harpegnathos saltator]EFN75485.1 Aminoacylase-1 [Harpegnathos saltator]